MSTQQPLTILLVEDERLVAMAEARTLAKHGFEVVTADSGEAAVEMAAHEQKIDLVLMDIDLGNGIDGTEAASRILSFRDLPIVFLTSHTEPEYVERVKRITNHGYVVKASGEFVLVESINMALKLFRANQRARERMKELNCLLELEKILTRREDSMEQALRKAANLIAESWEHPGLAVVRIRLESLEVATDGFREGSWSLHQDIPLGNESVGSVQVSYTTDTTRHRGDPFLPEERKLILAIATRLSAWLEQRRMVSRTQLKAQLLGSVTEAVVATDREGKIVYWNASAEKLYGWSSDEAYGEILAALHSKSAESGELIDLFARVLSGSEWSGVLTAHNRAGDHFPVHVNAAPVYDEGCEITGLITISSDITERKRIEKHLRHYKQAVDSLDEIVVAVDREARYLFANRAFLDRHQLTEEEVVGRPARDVLGVKVFEKQVRPRLEQSLQGKTVTFDMQFRYRDSDIRHLKVTYHPIESDDDEVVGVVSVIADVTDFVNAQERQRRQKMRARWISRIAGRVLSGLSVQNLVEHTVTEVAHGFPGMRVAYSTVNSEGTVRVLASTQPEHMPDIRGAEADLTRVPAYLAALRQGKPVIISDVRKDARIRPILQTIEAGNTRALLDVPLNHSETLVGVLCLDSPVPRDWLDEEAQALNEIAHFLALAIQNERSRKALERSEERYRQIVDDAPIGIVMVTSDGTFRTANPFFRDWLGYAESELRSFNVRDMTPSQDYEYEGQLIDEMESGLTEVVRLEKRYTRRDGTPVWGDLVTKVLNRGDSENRFRLGMVVDITERKEVEGQLQAALREKDHLMSEMNHRVKNNLSMVLSLIQLKQDTLRDDVDLSDIASQINAIRFIHEKLQASEDTSRVDFASYARDVVRSVLGSGIDAAPIIEIGDIALPTKAATTLGLIVNELATNAVKHGFGPDSEKRFSVSMEMDESSGSYVLVVSNTGREFPASINLERPQTLGLQLVTALTAQLRGELELQRKPYPVFTIRFPVSA